MNSCKTHPTSRSIRVFELSLRRTSVALAVLASAIFAAPLHAQWTVTLLNPAGQTGSAARGVVGAQQVGSSYTGGTPRAALWTGSAATWVNLSPASDYSSAVSSNGAQQVGYAAFGGNAAHAGWWNGTAPSWVDLNPAGSSSSFGAGVSGATQVGSVIFGGIHHAAKWTGTAASFVDLHPVGATISDATGISGTQQVGTAHVGGNDNACLWAGTAASFVNLNPTGATNSAALCTSGTQQGGYATFGGVGHAGIWSGTAASWVDLHPAGAMLSVVQGVSGGQQVGYVDPAGGGTLPSLWSGTAASRVTLPTVPGYSACYANAIWSNANVTYIVGYANSDTTLDSIALMWTRISNDQCASAWPVSEGTYFGTTKNATTDGSSLCGVGTANDVWYAYTPSTSGTVRINTCGADFDTVLSVHSGCPGTTANQIACSDDAGLSDCGGSSFSTQSSLMLTVAAQTTYMIRVAGYNGATGDYALNIVGVAPVNDACSNAIAITPGTYAGTTGFAGNDGSAACGISAGSPDVWYSITPAANGLARLDTCTSSYDTVLSVHTGCPGTAANAIACNDDAVLFSTCSGSIQSNIDLPVLSGHTYYVRVSGFNGLNGAFVLHYTLDATSNDVCPTATPVAVGTYGFNTTGATTDGPTEANCLFCCGDTQINQDIWFTYTAPCARHVIFDTLTSTFDTKIAVYAGCPFGNDSAVACNDDYNGVQSLVALHPVSGTTYYIRVGGYLSNAGPGVLHVKTCTADFNCDGVVQVNDIFVYLAAWFAQNGLPGPGHTADFNQDNTVNVSDIFAFLSAWFAGCP